ncbi:MAG: ATP-binding cassette domain-containing protein [Aeromicrobium sp.]
MTTSTIQVRGLTGGYARADVIRDIDLDVAAGEVVTLLGPNGAGKTATLLALAGELTVRSGEIRLGGTPVSGGLSRRTRRGLGYLPEGRSVFKGLSVRQNLQLGGGSVKDALVLAPELERMLGRTAGLLSGGEMQLLSVARLLAAKPSTIVVDELSLGLAPMILDRLLGLLIAAAADGAAVLLVEQQATRALAVADRAYVLSQGSVVHEGPADALAADTALLDRLYFGGTPGIPA